MQNQTNITDMCPFKVFAEIMPYSFGSVETGYHKVHLLFCNIETRAPPLMMAGLVMKSHLRPHSPSEDTSFRLTHYSLASRHYIQFHVSRPLKGALLPLSSKGQQLIPLIDERGSALGLLMEGILQSLNG
jgi:hypothetical protein